MGRRPGWCGKAGHTHQPAYDPDSKQQRTHIAVFAHRVLQKLQFDGPAVVLLCKVVLGALFGGSICVCFPSVLWFLLQNTAGFNAVQCTSDCASHFALLTTHPVPNGTHMNRVQTPKQECSNRLSVKDA